MSVFFLLIRFNVWLYIHLDKKQFVHILYSNFRISSTGVIILTVSGGYQSEKMGSFLFIHHLWGDFDGKIMRPA